jgi:hypothetical protein
MFIARFPLLTEMLQHPLYLPPPRLTFIWPLLLNSSTGTLRRRRVREGPEGMTPLIHAPPPLAGPMLQRLQVRGAWGVAMPNRMTDAHHIQRVSCNSSISTLLQNSTTSWSDLALPLAESRAMMAPGKARHVVGSRSQVPSLGVWPACWYALCWRLHESHQHSVRVV